ncbi:MAG TPA: DNA cytosine methyltransferase [Herpetosiphonaceae bacterium]
MWQRGQNRTHNENFPQANHDCTDISACNPRRYERTDILIASPECTNHSLAKGARRKSAQLSLLANGDPDPAAERSRATMWDVPRFAEVHRYQAIIVENVPDARHWELWPAWLHAMSLLGYDHQAVYLNSMFAPPTPQSRDRLYVVFWRRGNRAPDLDFRPPAPCPRCQQTVAAVQSWKNPQKRYGKYRQQYVYRCPTCAGEVLPFYHAAATAIDWGLPAERIGDRKKPLKDKTLARIRYGLEKFARQGLLVDFMHSGHDPSMVRSVEQPFRTRLSSPSKILVTPPGFLVGTAYTHEQHDRRSYPLGAPLVTQTARQDVGLCIPPFFAELRNHSTAREVTAPLSTLCASGAHHGLVTPPGWLTSYYGNDRGHSLTEAMPTVTTRDRHALICPPFVASQYGGRHAVRSVEEELPTVPGMAVHYLAQPGDLPDVDGCGFRMLFPHEVGAAMVFPPDYKVHGNKREQIKQYGNAVTPPAMQWLAQQVLATLG